MISSRTKTNNNTLGDSLKVTDTALEGVKVIEPKVYGDHRGWFFEPYNGARYFAAGITAKFVQDNESYSKRGVVRGLHWQAGKHAQAKLVRVIRGSVLDVVVDIRKGSPTFGQHVSVTLTDSNRKQLFIPRGFAHGFIALSDEVLFSYKCDNFYCPDSERGLLFSDPALGIQWPDVWMVLTFSDKDKLHPTLKDIEPWEDE